MEQHARMTGALLGFAVGDALGATTEFMTPDEIAVQIGVHREITGGGWLELEPGEVTDDTQMSLCVARSLCACRGFDLKDIADRFVEWYNSDPPDIGSTCRAAIHRYIRSGGLVAAYDERGAGNGGVMRALPLILYFRRDRDAVLETVLAQSRLTHNNKESDEGCRCYADLVSSALAGADMETLRRIANKYPLFAPDSFDGKSGGYVVETMRTVLHYFFATASFEECLVAVVNNGQDADTTGALAGGLAGCFYGAGSLPDRWLAVVDPVVRAELTGFADFMTAMDAGGRVETV